MMDALSGFIIRLLVGSFFSFSVCALAGKGSQAEPLRFACACFMLLLMLAPLKDGSISADGFEELWNDTQSQLVYSMEETNRRMLTDFHTAIDEELTAALQKAGVSGRVELCYTEEKVTGAKIWGISEEVEQIRERIMIYTGLERGQIEYMGVDPGGSKQNSGIFEKQPR